MIRLGVLAAGSIVLAGCGNSDGKPAYNAEEQKAVQQAKSMTPEQQLEAAQKSALPPDQKAALIQSIKEKNGLR